MSGHDPHALDEPPEDRAEEHPGWQEVWRSDDGEDRVERFAVPSGWLYRTARSGYEEQVAVFVPARHPPPPRREAVCLRRLVERLRQANDAAAEAATMERIIEAS